MALVDVDGTVLMQRRHFSAVHGGLWEFPGGKVEAGETPEGAGVRELHEELGVVLDPAGLVPVAFASGFTAGPEEGGRVPRRPLVLLLYACGEWQGEAHARDAEEIGWHAPEKIGALAMPPLDYPLADALARHLAYIA